MSYDLLEGVKVLELSMYAFAPSAAAVLSDWGADVIKVVPPNQADPMMGNPVAGLPAVDVGVSFMWEIMNRGKRCIGVDISTDGGHAVLLDLVRRSDVFITNLLPGARSRYRIDAQDLFEVNPGLIYARASGHGHRGPERESGGFDHTDYWARTGAAHAATMVSSEFVPQPIPAMGDLTAGGFLAGAVSAALYRRSRTGRGAEVDVSLLSAGVWVCAPSIVASQLYGIDAIPRMHHADLPNPLVAAYTTRDGREIYFAGVQTEGHFENFCEAIGRADLLEDPRFATSTDRLANAKDCIAVLDEVFSELDLGQWTERLGALTTPWTVIQTASEAARDQQVVANDLVIEVKGEGGEFQLACSPARFDDAAPELRRAPFHGEHTEDILQELGRSWDEIVALKADQAVL